MGGGWRWLNTLLKGINITSNGKQVRTLRHCISYDKRYKSINSVGTLQKLQIGILQKQKQNTAKPKKQTK